MSFRDPSPAAVAKLRFGLSLKLLLLSIAFVMLASALIYFLALWGAGLKLRQFARF